MIIIKKTTNKKDLKKAVLYDLEELKNCFITNNKRDFNLHFKLLKSNLKDLFKNNNLTN